MTQHNSAKIDDTHVMRSGIRTWITNDSLNKVHVSLYGKQDMTLQSQPISDHHKVSKAFSLAVDQDAVTRASQELADKRRERRDKEKEAEQLRGEHDVERAKMEKALRLAVGLTPGSPKADSRSERS